MAARKHQKKGEKSILFLSSEIRKHHFLEGRLHYRGYQIRIVGLLHLMPQIKC